MGSIDIEGIEEQLLEIERAMDTLAPTPEARLRREAAIRIALASALSRLRPSPSGCPAPAPIPSEPVALFDLDGTLADFDAAMSDEMRKLAAEGEPPWDSGGPGEEAEDEHIRFRRRLVKQIPGFWARLPRMIDGFEALRMAMSIGYQIMVLSRGPRSNPRAWGEKLEWCQGNLPPSCQVTLTEDKGLVYGRVLVDDWPPYIERWLSWRGRGLVIMPARRWNSRFSHPQVIRYSHGQNDGVVHKALSSRLKGDAF